ncbi:DUF6134 family protein [Terrimonas pollutisoli]|uniref:DUF6134 family protein n=1 Tax=Terrimonas pollutisoli TaxID=3034147 RepID=UPI0023EAF9A7|nr:DUF6134 family protein [Terrimonas sp. H1YJ31]
MIPTIIFLLLRRYGKTHPAKAEQLALLLRKAGKFFFIFILLILTCYIAFSQTSQLQYSVKRKGAQIGIISFTQQFVGNKRVFKVESEIKTRILFLFTAIGQEESVYENGIMISSFVYQKLNGNEQVNKKTTLVGRNYIVSKGNHSETLSNYPIFYNMICLYAKEPVDVPKVYSDKSQQFLDIQTIGDHHYRIKFPDGNYNEYFYQDGLCTRVEVHHKFYRSSFELIN